MVSAGVAAQASTLATSCERAVRVTSPTRNISTVAITRFRPHNKANTNSPRARGAMTRSQPKAAKIASGGMTGST